MSDWITGPLSVAWHLRWVLVALLVLGLFAGLLDANHRLRRRNSALREKVRELKSDNISLRDDRRRADLARGRADRAFSSPRKASGR